MSGNDANQTAARWAQICAVLDAVLDAPHDQRDRILGERCAGDPALRDEVEVLLRADADAGERLESPVLDWASALLENAASAPAADEQLAGMSIGPWRMIDQLGRGGMGTVWLAERIDGDFEQRVALKLLKRGMDSDAILARFIAERRILARLAHPNIARLIDGGVTPDGRPWFAMELVDGETITRWCDAHRLPVHERLRLFLAVVDAVQHAHRELVVHRDLKPSNILVNASGEVKLLDFGIAKLLDAPDAPAGSATVTQLGGRMLTPEYAAPEQLRGEAVTTATDVYALGVLLYELLTGKRPSPARNHAAAVFAATDKLPPRPSTQITEHATEARATHARRLAGMLRGDLDTIVLRALHPEPECRYGTAEALRDDLQRYLDGQPVRARPDSAWYRARKFAVRNRIAVGAAALLMLSLASGLLATAWQAREARLRADEAEQQARRAEQVKAFLIEIFEAGGPQEWRGGQPTARDLLDAGAKRVDEELASDPALHAEMLAVIGTLHKDQGNLERADALLRRSLDERRTLFGDTHELYADSLIRLSALLGAKGDWIGAENHAAEAVSILRSKLGEDPRTAQALGTLSDVQLSLGQSDKAIALRRQALAIHRRTQGNLDADVADDLRALGAFLVERERYREAEPLFTEALRIDAALYGTQSVRYASSLDTQANLLYQMGKTERAADAYRRAAAIYRAADDAGNEEDALNHYGVALCRLGRFDEAETHLRQSIALVRQHQPAGSQWIGIRLASLGGCLTEAGRPAEAEPLLREALAIVERAAGAEHTWTSYALRKLAEALIEQGKIDEARPLVERALRQLRKHSADDHAKIADTLRVLAAVRFAQGDRREGLTLAQDATQSLLQAQGPRHPQTTVASLALAALELQAGRALEAETRLREIEPVFEAIGDKPRALTARMLRGAALIRLGRFDACQSLLRPVVDARARTYGEASAKTAEAQIYLGTCLAGSGRSEEARRLLDRGRDTLTNRYGTHHEMARIASAELARLH